MISSFKISDAILVHAPNHKIGVDLFLYTQTEIVPTWKANGQTLNQTIQYFPVFYEQHVLCKEKIRNRSRSTKDLG